MSRAKSSLARMPLTAIIQNSRLAITRITMGLVLGLKGSAHDLAIGISCTREVREKKTKKQKNESLQNTRPASIVILYCDRSIILENQYILVRVCNGLVPVGTTLSRYLLHPLTVTLISLM